MRNLFLTITILLCSFQLNAQTASADPLDSDVQELLDDMKAKSIDDVATTSEMLKKAKADIDALEKENSNLTEQNDKLDDENELLEKENKTLAEEVKGLVEENSTISAGAGEEENEQIAENEAAIKKNQLTMATNEKKVKDNEELIKKNDDEMEDNEELLKKLNDMVENLQ